MPFVLLLGNFLSHFCRLKILSTLGGWLDEIVIGCVIVISIGKYYSRSWGWMWWTHLHSIHRGFCTQNVYKKNSSQTLVLKQSIYLSGEQVPGLGGRTVWYGLPSWLIDWLIDQHGLASWFIDWLAFIVGLSWKNLPWSWPIKNLYIINYGSYHLV